MFRIHLFFIFKGKAMLYGEKKLIPAPPCTNYVVTLRELFNPSEPTLPGRKERVIIASITLLCGPLWRAREVVCERALKTLKLRSQTEKSPGAKR